ncbi:permease prefix domain 1-containing protein [Luteitalea pratensis]|uniref:permease prefix domain 1-containing protein n=1 Tax=Luteitalea pratensis TaxID=1855912 RepID=UPI000D72D3FD|nr:permease prefix domain 1-containing protein [Luteitalea pratensis]
MARLLNLLPWQRRRLEHELARELADHIERRVDDLVQSGVDVADARRRAGLEFGSVTQVQEEVRDAWFWRWLDDLGRDMRYGVRALRRSPVFTATAILSLAIGIGANAALFSLVDRILLRVLAVPEPGQLVRLAWTGSDLTGKWGSGALVSYPLCRELSEQVQVFDGVLCRHPTMVALSMGREREQVRAEIVSGSYFQVLGAHPATGRLFDRSDDEPPGTRPVVVLSHAYWRDNRSSGRCGWSDCWRRCQAVSARSRCCCRWWGSTG